MKLCKEESHAHGRERICTACCAAKCYDKCACKCKDKVA